ELRQCHCEHAGDRGFDLGSRRCRCACCAHQLTCKRDISDDTPERHSSMKANSLLTSAILVLAIGEPIAAFVENTSMALPQTSPWLRRPFLHGQLDGLLSRSTLPSVERATEWINSPPLTASALRGKVVLVDFWTYTCINWLRTLPYVRGWAEKYRDQ